jgi:hypothetical protein
LPWQGRFFGVSDFPAFQNMDKAEPFFLKWGK